MSEEKDPKTIDVTVDIPEEGAAEAPPASDAGGVADKDRNMWCMFCHLAAFAGAVGIPLGNVVGPVVVWAIKKNEIPEVDAHGKEAINFQISMLIYFAVGFALTFVFVGIFVLVAVGIAWLVLVIMAAVKANDGELYRYPVTIRFLK